MNKWELIYESEQPISKEEENQMYQDHQEELKEQKLWEETVEEMIGLFEYSLTKKQIQLLVENKILTENAYRDIMEGK